MREQRGNRFLGDKYWFVSVAEALQKKEIFAEKIARISQASGGSTIRLIPAKPSGNVSDAEEPKQRNDPGYYGPPVFYGPRFVITV
jgi:hypothetical protein